MVKKIYMCAPLCQKKMEKIYMSAPLCRKILVAPLEGGNFLEGGGASTKN